MSCAPADPYKGDGLSIGNAFRTVGKVNSLNLQPGDKVLFKCGDTWRAEQLVISKSGTEAAPIVFGSYPEGCANKPILSGSQPITGWTVYSGTIYQANLPGGEFPLGINQLFRNGQRLTLGRWPNLDAGNGGYSFVDNHTAGSNQITDNELPASVNWVGAIVHIKNIRWSMLDRQVTRSSGHTLVLNTGLYCERRTVMRVKHLLAPLALLTAALLAVSAPRSMVAAPQVTVYPAHPRLIIGGYRGISPAPRFGG